MIRKNTYFQRVFYLLCCYLLTILFFTALYFQFSEYIHNPRQEAFASNWACLLDSLYFSVSTITTLGYGDLTATRSWLRLASSLESVIGIFIFGLFISATWDYYTEKREIDQRKNTLSDFYSIFQDKFIRHKIAISLLVHKKSDRNPQPSIPENIKLSDLRFVFEKSKFGGETVDYPTHYKKYMVSAKKLHDDLTLFLLTTNLAGFETLRDSLIRLIRILDDQPFESAMLDYSEADDEILDNLVMRLTTHEELESGGDTLLEDLKIRNQTFFYPFYRLRLSLENQQKIITEYDQIMSDLHFGKLAPQT